MPLEVRILEIKGDLIVAKRKKHRKKQHNHKQNVVKKTTSQPQQVELSSKDEGFEVKNPVAAESKTVKTAEMADVRYSLVLAGIIVAVFIVMYIALQNQAIANSVYGLVKLNNLSF